MTPKDALELLENRLSKLAINHKIGSRDIANSEIKEIVTAIERHVIPTLEDLVVEHEALKRDVARYFELLNKDIEYREIDEYDGLYEKLSKENRK